MTTITELDSAPSPGHSAEEPAVKVKALSKRYGDLEVVRGIDLTVQVGEVYAFLGPNGAGKSTTVEILEGYRRRSGGTVSVLGSDPAEPSLAWRARIGVVLQASKMPAELTVLELVERYAGFYPHPRGVEQTIEIVGLVDKRRSRAAKLSGGQLRRLDVALAIVGDPELLFLDEPTTGLDPAARHETWQLIRGLRDLGKTVFLTTHFMDEAQALADRVAVIVAGKIVAEGSPDTIAGRDTAPVEITFRRPPGTEPPISAGTSVQVQSVEDHMMITTTDPVHDLGLLLDWARLQGVDLAGLEVRRPSLEEMYLKLTGAQT
jgi:ABC-2 type transport system ATP-binding protein